MFDNDTAIGQHLSGVSQLPGKHDEGEELDPMKYVEKYKRQIEIAGRLFGYLGLEAVSKGLSD